MPQFADQRLDVGGDHRFVLDDQHAGGQFGVDLGLGLGDQHLDLGRTGPQDVPGLRRIEPFEGRQQEGLARTRRDAQQAARGIVAFRRVRLGFQARAGAAPDDMEYLIQRDPRGELGRQGEFARRQGLQRRTNVGIPCGLISGEGASVSAHIR